MSVLFCDTNCELWFDIAEELGLNVIRMPYTCDGVEYYYDLGKETNFDDFYARVRGGSMPTTAALNMFNYLEYFEPYFEQGEDILYLSFSHKLSATFEFMNSAVQQLLEKYPERKFTVFDTASISMGAGIQVYYAAKMKKDGASDEEILAFLKKFSPEVKTVFAVDDLNHLKRGGRVSGAAAALGTLIGIKPIIKIEEGKLKPTDKVKGMKKVFSYFLEEMKKFASELEKYDVWVMQADCLERGEEIAQLIRNNFPEATVHVQKVGPVIASHCGPGTVGLVFHGKADA